MHQLTLRCLGLLTLVLSTACGPSTKQYQSALGEIANLRAEMAAERTNHQQRTREIQNRAVRLEEENQVMKTNLVAMGQDLSQLKSKTGVMVEQLSQKEEQIAKLMRAQEAARKRAEMFKQLVGQFQRMIDAGKLNIKIRKGRMIVRMNENVLFAAGHAVLKPDGQEALVEVTAVLKEIPDRHFQVAGHTDNVPISTTRFQSNWELSTSRAVNVVKFMTLNGMDPSRLSAAGYGQYDPVGDNATEEGRAMNRRIEITLMPSLEELPR